MTLLQHVKLNSCYETMQVIVRTHNLRKHISNCPIYFQLKLESQIAKAPPPDLIFLPSEGLQEADILASAETFRSSFTKDLNT